MTTRAAAASGIWRARNTRTQGDHAYMVYMALMVALVAVAPLGRAVWLIMTSPETVALFASAASPSSVVLLAALWTGALLWGRDRGPALLPPFLTYALATSDQSRAQIFSAPLLRSSALVVGLTAIAAAMIGGTFLNAGMLSPLNTVLFVVAGALVGVITTVAWLAGQALPRAAVPIVIGVLVIGGLALGGLSTGALLVTALTAVTVLAALTVVLLAAIPLLLDRLGLAELSSQAARWDSATTHAIGMDFGAATTVYRGRPYVGRSIRAVRPLGRGSFGRGLAVFFVRDAVGAVRTPGRFALGVFAIALAGALLALAFTPSAPSWALGAMAGLVLFAGLGSVTDGIRHAVSVSADLPLYGISDGRLLASHVLFPLAATIVALFAGVFVLALFVGGGLAASMISALVLGLLGIVARLGNALKGPLPPVLLTPIPTPLGDLGAAVRMAWALDAVLLAAVIGAAAALIFEVPVLFFVVAVTAAGVAVYRWRHRR